MADTGHNRALRYNGALTKPNGAGADKVLGQPLFTTGILPTLPTASSLSGPTGVWVDSSNNLWVADKLVHRVVRFDNLFTPTVTWANPAAITYGTPLSATQLNATANVPGTFSYTPSAGTVLNGGTGQTLSVTFTPTDSSESGPVTKTVTIDVNKASQTITFGVLLPKTYGAASFALSASASSGLPVSYTIVSGPATVSGNIVTITGAGTVTVGASQAGNTNYTAAANVDRSFIVTPAPLVITADSKTKAVNTANPPLTASYTGFVNGENASVLDTPVTLATTAVTNSPAGIYLITASGAADANYTIAFLPGLLTVTSKQVPLITWNDPISITYGTPLGSGQLNATTSVPGVFSYSPALGTVLHAGDDQTLSVTFTPTDTGTYIALPVTAHIDVAPAPLTITAASTTKVYGDPLPALTATASGLVNGDALSTLDTPLSLSTTATASSNVGSYPITPLAIDSDYAIHLVNGTLNVTPAPLTITADNLTKLVDTPNPTLTASYSGLVNGDTALSLNTPVTLTTTATLNSPVGTYPITAGLALDPNYAINLVNGVLTVTPKLLPTITWPNPAAITYGTPLGATQLNATASVPGVLSYTPTIGAVLDAGNNQPLTVSFTPADLGTYAPLTLNTHIDVLPATLTVTATNATKVYGAALPTLGLSVSGLVNGDALSTLDVPATVSTLATAGSAVGSYVLAPVVSDANYAITLVNGTLNVTPAPLTITADNLTKLVDTLNPTLTASSSGLVNGDTFASLIPPVSLATTATLNSPAGSYPITASGAANPNYTITFVAGTLTVTAKQVPTITWPTPAAIAYGTPLGAAQLNATASVPGTFSYTPAAGTVLHAGNTQTISVVFTPTDTATYASSSATVMIDVARATQTITFAALPNKTLGDPPFTISATASSGSAITFSSTTPAICTVSGSSVTLLAVGTCTITANQSGSTDYAAAAPMSQSFTVAGGATDADSDGLPDSWETQYGLNPNDAAGVNGASGDPDGDGLTNSQEYANGTDPHNADTDGDGLPDGWEVQHGLNPKDATGVNGASGDPDGDGLSNLQEDQHGTDPHNADTDGDGLSDGWEVQYGLNPNNPTGDNGANGDPDGDGLSNGQEYSDGTNPTVADPSVHRLFIPLILR